MDSDYRANMSSHNTFQHVALFLFQIINIFDHFSTVYNGLEQPFIVWR